MSNNLNELIIQDLLNKELLNEHIVEQDGYVKKPFRKTITSLIDKKQVPITELYRSIAKFTNSLFIETRYLSNDIIDYTILKQVPFNIWNKTLSFPLQKEIVIDYYEDNKIQLPQDNSSKKLSDYKYFIVMSQTFIPHLRSSIISTLQDNIDNNISHDDVVFIISDVTHISQILRHVESNLNKENGNIVAVNRESDAVIILENILENALMQGASDIHILPADNYVTVRFRINGILTTVEEWDKGLYEKITRILFLEAGLNYDRAIKINDGKIEKRLDKTLYEFRFSAVPTHYGPTIVLRLYTGADNIHNISQLGFLQEEMDKIELLIDNPYGIVLLTGPTGSGKSTTLYSMLNRIGSDASKKILSVEDPVEVNLPVAQQISYNAERGITFDNAIKAFLRQDPDVIMVGEIRDKNTAMEAVTAAITGHLVLSTLHTNTALESILRLTSIGLQPWQVSASMMGVVGQRLVKKLCTKCAIPIKFSEYKLKYKLKRDVPLLHDEDIIYTENPKGCNNCYKGFTGRQVVAEVLMVDDIIKEKIASQASIVEIKKYAKENNFRSMVKVGVETMKKGNTSFNELKRIFGSQIYVTDY